MARSLVNDFLVKLADAIAPVANLPRPATLDADHRCALWAHEADDSLTPTDAEGPSAYTVLRAFVAPPVNNGRARVAIQAATRGPTAARAIAQNEAVHNALLDSPAADGVERREWAIGGPQGFVCSIYRLSFGGVVARDEKGWSTCVTNFEAAYRPASLTP